MTEIKLKEIIEIAQKRWKIDDYFIIHRYGSIKASENIVLILVASQHRKDSIESLSFIIDWLKIKAPFWKKEISKDGELWIEQKKDDVLRAKRHNFNID